MLRLRGIATLVLVAALVAALAGCNNVDAIARVNGENITREEFDRYYDQVVSQMGAELDEATALNYKQQLLDMMIESMLITQEAEELGADLSEEVVDAKITELMGGSTDTAAFEEQVAAAGLDMEDVRKSVRDQIAREYLTEKAQEEYSTDALTETYTLLSHILVADEATANDLHAQIVAGGDFATLAATYSTDTASSIDGGSLGWSPTSAYVSEFAAAADALEVGDLSDPVQSDFGWHIILKVDQRDAGEELADAPAELQEMIDSMGGDVALQQYVDKLWEDAEIKYYDETLMPAE
ncbi:MAG: peptidylprolyl isomerase [Coriobacteriia bacterium]|nr:peptidylprolyl isomerase [Coriobacteriia bacterium]